MTKKQAEQEFWQYYVDLYGHKENAIMQLGITTIRCAWVDFIDYLSKDHRITEHQRMTWGQII